MNNKQAKKLRQIFKRDLRQELHKKVIKDAELWLQMLRPKPKLMPTWLWKLGSKIYFTEIGQHQIYKTKI